jgi:hypothetical protein
MRWSFLDRIITVSDNAIATQKAMSFEEYYLEAPLGRRGILPASLLVECGVEAVRALVEIRSGFKKSVLLSSIEEFRIIKFPWLGDVIDISTSVTDDSGADHCANCTMKVNGKTIAQGVLRLSKCNLADLTDPDHRSSLLREIYVDSQRQR